MAVSSPGAHRSPLVCSSSGWRAGSADCDDDKEKKSDNSNVVTLMTNVNRQ